MFGAGSVQMSSGVTGVHMSVLTNFLFNEEGQDIAEYAVMVAVILIVVIGTIRLIGSNSNTVFSNVASTIQ
jgi:Flp pilus assembly pilin Flp